MITCKRIGICGGTFDPIHIGHLIIAETVRQEMGLEKIVFIASGDPPHKNEERITSPKVRFDMVKLAIGDNPYFEASSIEIDRPGVTYTVDTLTQLCNQTSNRDDILCKFIFIIGVDVLRDIFTWRRYKDVFKLCEFAAVLRPGFNREEFDYYKKLAVDEGAIINEIAAPLIEISSSDIRNRITNCKSVKYMIPIQVEQYINDTNLYKTIMPQKEDYY